MRSVLGKIKAAVQDRLYQGCIEEYNGAIRYQKEPYALWIKKTEQQDEGDLEKNYPSLSVVYMEQCIEGFCLQDVKNEIILFVSKQGRISLRAFDKFVTYFEKHPNVDVVYANEDIWMLTPDKEEIPDDQFVHRTSPWMKPCWSPDTLLSFQYFGNIFAVRKSAFEKLQWLGDKDYKKNIYDFLLQATEGKTKVGQLEDILFHTYEKGMDAKQIEEQVMHKREFWGAGKEYDAVRQRAFARRKWSAVQTTDKVTGFTYPIYQLKEDALVSIIIPSKDNRDVLKQCIRSIYQHTEYKNFEIIVVDNGSSAQTRMSLEKFKEECAFTYLYQPMDFNFSKMCNTGVRHAKGDYILLLNDDMEAIEDTWLTRMIGQASLPHVGAVGAKLLYPNTSLIQHAGVTNTCSGPGHKLKKLDDTTCYYYGRNKLIYDMLGVTAACLLMRKKLFVKLDGLYEGLPVAYNDVDLCFRVHENGFYNVQRNDVVLYHHESLSRGDDLQDEKKLNRLKHEMEILYSRHPKLKRYDPFNARLVNSGDSEYKYTGLEWYEIAMIDNAQNKLVSGKRLPNEKHMNHAIMIVLEDCGKQIYEHDEQEYSGYLVKGWAYVPGVDNARYQMKLLLRDAQGNVWEMPIMKRLREDVAAILPHEVNVELTGFCCWIAEGIMPEGTYDVWLTAKDGCSRQVLYRSAEKQLEIKA